MSEAVGLGPGTEALASAAPRQMLAPLERGHAALRPCAGLACGGLLLLGLRNTRQRPFARAGG
eukprot:8277760-Alexandrium_andersonii.AAC.1